MEITREIQIKAIDEGIKELGITQHRLEKQAGIAIGTINDLRRGKTHILRADKWSKICAVIGDGFTKEEEMLVENFRAMPPDKQRLLLEMVQSLAKTG